MRLRGTPASNNSASETRLTATATTGDGHRNTRIEATKTYASLTRGSRQ